MVKCSLCCFLCPRFFLWNMTVQSCKFCFYFYFVFIHLFYFFNSTVLTFLFFCLFSFYFYFYPAQPTSRRRSTGCTAHCTQTSFCTSTCTHCTTSTTPRRPCRRGLRSPSTPSMAASRYLCLFNFPSYFLLYFFFCKNYFGVLYNPVPLAFDSFRADCMGVFFVVFPSCFPIFS